MGAIEAVDLYCSDCHLKLAENITLDVYDQTPSRHEASIFVGLVGNDETLNICRVHHDEWRHRPQKGIRHNDMWVVLSGTRYNTIERTGFLGTLTVSTTYQHGVFFPIKGMTVNDILERKTSE